MKKIMMVAAIVCCMVVQAQSIRDDLTTVMENVNTISNAIVVTEKSIVEVSANTNLSAVARGSAIEALKKQVETLKKDLLQAKQSAKQADKVLKLYKDNVIKAPIGAKGGDLNMSKYGADSFAAVVTDRYNRGKKIYHTKMFSAVDDTLNDATIRGILNINDADVQCQLAYEYLAEQCE